MDDDWGYSHCRKAPNIAPIFRRVAPRLGLLFLGIAIVLGRSVSGHGWDGKWRNTHWHQKNGKSRCVSSNCLLVFHWSFYFEATGLMIPLDVLWRMRRSGFVMPVWLTFGIPELFCNGTRSVRDAWFDSVHLGPARVEWPIHSSYRSMQGYRDCLFECSVACLESQSICVCCDIQISWLPEGWVVFCQVLYIYICSYVYISVDMTMYIYIILCTCIDLRPSSTKTLRPVALSCLCCTFGTSTWTSPAQWMWKMWWKDYRKIPGDCVFMGIYGVE